jgi:hypothetical protein
MFNPRARISSKAVHDRLLKERAVEEGRALFKAMGEDGIHLTSLELLDPSRGAEERRHTRLMMLEMERLYRMERHGAPSQQLVIWKPPLFSLARFKSFLGMTRTPRRRH